jgi:3-isopropylmalate/(R)-2-methylmalate dehydratase large subunit
MGWNIFEKIIMRHTNQKEVAVDDIVEVEVDGMMIHDFFAPFCISKFNEMGFKKVAAPDRVAFIYDHLVPTSFVDDSDHHQAADEFVATHNITRVHRSDGVCHQLMPEQGYVKPGDIVVGTDSHTVTYGALGAIATGIGYTEMAAVMGTGKIWLKVAPSIKVVLTGELPQGVFSKDLILEVLRILKTDGASYRILEFCGPVVEALSVDSRLTLANMSVEAGAKAGLVAPDEKTVQYLKGRVSGTDITMLSSDPDAIYEDQIVIDVSKLGPLVAQPFSPDNVAPVGQVDAPVQQAFLGSCTNGRLEDLAAASQVLQGHRVHPDVRLYVVPASREVFQAAIEQNYVQRLVDADAIIGHPACSLCAGRSGGILENGEAVISSNNRNFYGRMGGNKVGIYLASPATVAASAIEGRITDCRKYL